MQNIIRETIDVMIHKRAAIYIRVSTNKQVENGTSLDTQEEKCLEYCAARKYRIIQKPIYKDIWTGIEYRERPGLTQLREDARKGLFDVVVIYAFDRLARKQVHQGVIIEDLRQNGVSIESVTESFDDSATGQSLRNASAFAAELEHGKISERTQRGRMAKLNKGRLYGAGIPTYGYEWNKEHTAYIINHQEAEIVRLIFRLYVEENYSIRAIRLHLENTNVPNRKKEKGLAWATTTLARLLANPYYIGEGVSNKWRAAKPGARAMTKKSPENYIKLADGIVPAIIDKETYEKAQEKLAVNKQLAARNNPEPEKALLRNGYAVCGRCGRILVVKKAYQAKCGYHYVCDRSADRDKCSAASIVCDMLDEAARAYIQEIIKDKTKVEERLAEIKGMLTDPRTLDLKPIEDKIAEVERHQKNCALGIARARDEYTIDLLSAEMEILALTRKELEQMLGEVRKKAMNIALLEEKIERFRNKWLSGVPLLHDKATFQDEREACQILGIEAIVWGKDHTPRYKFTMRPPEIVSLTS